MRLSRTTKLAYLAMAACVLAGCGFDVLGHTPIIEGRWPLVCCHVFTFASYAGFVVIWLRLARYRFLDRRVLACLRRAGWTMIAWLAVRTVKYELLHGLPGIFARYLWYAFYVGYTFIPAILMFAVLHLGKRTGEPVAHWALLPAGAAVLFALVLTNDIHQLAFRFEGGLDFVRTDDGSAYSYGPVFYATWVWISVLATAAIVVALARCRRATSRVALLVPLSILGMGFAYLVLYAVASPIRRIPLKTVEFSCIMLVAFMESLVVLGLFPSNERYGELWRASSLQGGLMDARGRVVDAAESAPDVTARQVAQACERPLPLSEGRVLVARRVRGGVAFWVRDFSRIRALQDQLGELGDTLAEENAVLAAENELAHEREVVRQRQALYDEVAMRTAGMLEGLSARLRDVPQDEGDFLGAMHRAAVDAACIKRCANLVLLGADGTIDLREVALALEEVASWLQSCGVGTDVHVRAEGAVPSADALRAFEAFCACARDAAARPDGATLRCELASSGLTASLLGRDGAPVEVSQAFPRGGADA